MIEDKNLIRKIALFLDPNDLCRFLRTNKMIYNALNCKEFWIMKNLHDHYNEKDPDKYPEREDIPYNIEEFNKKGCGVKPYRNLYFRYHSLPVYLEFRIKQVPIDYEESFSVGVQIRLPFLYSSIDEYLSDTEFYEHLKEFVRYCGVSKYTLDYDPDHEYLESLRKACEKDRDYEDQSDDHIRNTYLRLGNNCIS